MGKILTRFEHDYIAVKIEQEKEKDLGGGIKVGTTSTNTPCKVATVLQCSEEAEKKYKEGDTLLIKPSRADSERELNGTTFSLIKMDDVIALV